MQQTLAQLTKFVETEHRAMELEIQHKQLTDAKKILEEQNAKLSGDAVERERVMELLKREIARSARRKQDAAL